MSRAQHFYEQLSSFQQAESDRKQFLSRLYINLCIEQYFILIFVSLTMMKPSILDLPDEILLDIFARYITGRDLNRLVQVCRRFRTLLLHDQLSWKKALCRLTNVSFSQLLIIK